MGKNNKRIIKVVVFIIVTVISFVLGKYGNRIEIPINSNNSTYRIYAQQAVINDKGQLTINGVVKNTVTGDAVTFASQGVVKLDMQK